MAISILRAGQEHVDLLAPLFSGYRLFYKQIADHPAERRFLNARLSNQESIVFIAIDEHAVAEATGFVQLYSSFDSVELSPIWILHDLFVAPDCRNTGVGRALMMAAQEFCVGTTASRIDLSTAVTNNRAKPLYESLGYERDDEFDHYSLSLE